MCSRPVLWSEHEALIYNRAYQEHNILQVENFITNRFTVIRGFRFVHGDSGRSGEGVDVGSRGDANAQTLCPYGNTDTSCDGT